MLALALLFWLLPYLILPLAWAWVLRASHWRAPLRNALATALAAASLVTVVLHSVALSRTFTDAERHFSQWQPPAISDLASCFAALAGWACCIIWLSLRSWTKGHWGQPHSPTLNMVVGAWCILLGLVIAYTEAISRLGADLS